MAGITIWGPESRNWKSQTGIHGLMRTTLYGVRVGDLMDVMNDMEASLPGEIWKKEVDVWHMIQPELPVKFRALKPEMGKDRVEVRFWNKEWPPAVEAWFLPMREV